jgi:plasmid stabilization system protein ParE
MPDTTSSFVLTPRAKSDVFEIWRYIAENNEDAASRVEGAIFDACSFVVKNPLIGHARPDLPPPPTGSPLAPGRTRKQLATLPPPL